MHTNWLVVASLCVSFAVSAEPVDQRMPGRELGLGNYADQEYVGRSILVLNEPLNRRVTEIGNRVAKVAGNPEVKYTFRIINDPVVKAFASAGGYVYIHVGLLDVLTSPDELAAVIAHEVAHVASNDLVRTLDGEHLRDIGAKTGGIIGGFSLALLGSAAKTYINQNTTAQVPGLPIGDYMSLGMDAARSIADKSIDGYKSDRERDADRLALNYLRDAGYSPMALPSTFKILKQVQEGLEQSEEKYLSALINKAPGLDERLRLVNEALQEMNLSLPTVSTENPK